MINIFGGEPGLIQICLFVLHRVFITQDLVHISAHSSHKTYKITKSEYTVLLNGKSFQFIQGKNKINWCHRLILEAWLFCLPFCLHFGCLLFCLVKICCILCHHNFELPQNFHRKNKHFLEKEKLQEDDFFLQNFDIS